MRRDERDQKGSLVVFQYKKSLWSVTCKLFADIERLRVREEANRAEERKRKAEESTGREERLKMRKEWDKNYEVNPSINPRIEQQICFSFFFFS